MFLSSKNTQKSIHENTPLHLLSLLILRGTSSDDLRIVVDLSVGSVNVSGFHYASMETLACLPVLVLVNDAVLIVLDLYDTIVLFFDVVVVCFLNSKMIFSMVSLPVWTTSACPVIFAFRWLAA